MAELIQEFKDYLKQYESNDREVAKLFSTYTDNQLNWRPDDFNWSIAENIQHLNVTAITFLEIIDSMMGEIRNNRLHHDGPFKHGFVGRIFLKAVEPPPLVKVSAPKHLLPVKINYTDQLKSDFDNIQKAFVEKVQQLPGLDITRAKRPIPVNKYLKLDLGQWFLYNAAHTRRHLWQIRGVINNKQFPAK
jgi:hypothetical protein